MSRLPKYAKEKMKGNIGESFVQYVLSQFCLVHSIDGSNDIGNDFICELIKSESPTNLLFYVQVKYCKAKPSISPELKEYWKGSPIPVFLFWVKDNLKNPIPSNNSLLIGNKSSIFYKRYTPIVHSKRHKNEKFKQYNDNDFKRDLIVDYIRSIYKMGFTPVVKPRDYLEIDEKIIIGFDKYLLFKEVASEYKTNILNQSWANLFVVANLLKENGDLAKAKKSIELASDLLEEADIEEKVVFLDTVRHEMQEVNKLLDEKNSNKSNLPL